MKKQFISNSFILTKNDSITDILLKNKVPNTFGIYIIYKNEKIYENIIYIGKAGEIDNIGVEKKQGLSKRLSNTRDKKSANEYFKDLFNHNIKELIIEYYETPKTYIPSFIEATLIQEYFQTFKKLPSLNKAY
ncbi:hypothetical protein ACIB15232_0162 [Aliarcobacter cibarius]|uniref:hypothetical protein n=1 Tax=Aliarcobacter cibarius TaxID=255507 RepID=UPI0012478B1A|nr:hypothetical protein [Aliarcobacter cibarius]QEZ88359.1 hypothetical protein ACIB15232_0162 [Aliarcobacter cibarius]